MCKACDKTAEYTVSIRTLSSLQDLDLVEADDSKIHELVKWYILIIQCQRSGRENRIH